MCVGVGVSASICTYVNTQHMNTKLVDDDDAQLALSPHLHQHPSNCAQCTFGTRTAYRLHRHNHIALYTIYHEDVQYIIMILLFIYAHGGLNISSRRKIRKYPNGPCHSYFSPNFNQLHNQWSDQIIFCLSIIIFHSYFSTNLFQLV